LASSPVEGGGVKERKDLQDSEGMQGETNVKGGFERIGRSLGKNKKLTGTLKQ